MSNEKEVICGAQTSKQDKHTGLISAINNIDSVIERQGNLIYKIRGEDVPKNDPCDEIHPSLLDVLSGGEGDIRGKIERLHAQMAEIEELLF